MTQQPTAPTLQQEIVQDDVPWYAIHLFTIRQQEVADYFQDNGLTYFIPMQYVDYEDRDGKHRRKLAPVVRNLLFLKKTVDKARIVELVANSNYKMYVLRKSNENREFYEIPARQMYEFQVMCNPDLLIRQYLSESEAKLKVGTRVNVTHGPLKGLSGKLVRQSRKYFLLKEVPGMAVMIKVTRWCCQPIED